VPVNLFLALSASLDAYRQGHRGVSAASWWRRLTACSSRGAFVCRITNAQVWPLLHGASIPDWQSARGRLLRPVAD